MTVLLAVAAIALGLVTCFAGYPLLRFLLGVLGFAAGAIAGSAAVTLAIMDPAPWVLPVGLVMGGVIGAVLAQFFFMAGVFLVGASFGALAGGVLSARFGFEPALGVLIAALAGGILAMGLQRPLIALSTAFIGAWLLISGGFSLFGWESPLLVPTTVLHEISQGAHGSFLLLWALCGMLGFGLQMRPKRKKEEA